MFALFTAVEFAPAGRDAAVKMLGEYIVPELKKLPGFVRGTWFGDETTGHGLVIFETEDQARQAAESVVAVEGMTVTRSGVYLVDAEA